MRLSTEREGQRAAEEEDAIARAIETIRVALDGGVRLLDTAHAYGRDDADAGHNERLVARAVRESGVVRAQVRIVTKARMRRPDGGWVPDGRAKAIEEDVRASRDALDGAALDVLLLHAIDPRTPLSTSVRALARALDRGDARAIGVSNVTRTQLEEALRVAPITCVQVALGAHDDSSARGGLVQLCADRGIEVLAHSPLGGPQRAARLSRDRTIAAIARDVGVDTIELVIAYLSRVHPAVVPLVGVRRVESARGLIAASRLALPEETLVRLDARFPALGALRRPVARTTPTSDREVVVLMGLPGAGKSRLSHELSARGHERLNRDERGGTLGGLARALEKRLVEGATSLVLDGTYVTRAVRNDAIVAAQRHGARVRCVHVDTPLAEAQINVVTRMLERHGRLLEPDELVAAQAAGEVNLVRPSVLFRMARSLEPPSMDEGFDQVDVVPFVRAHDADATRAGALIALDAAMGDEGASIVARSPAGAACLLYAWKPDATDDWLEHARAHATRLAAQTDRTIEVAVCRHAGGPPTCWCRPPLPGLWLAFARRHRIHPARSVAIGDSAGTRGLARALGLAHLVVDLASR